MKPPEPGAVQVRAPLPLETTAHLLDLARTGDGAARERLFRRYLPPLTRWAHRRLPSGARDLHETDDLVQVTLMRALAHLHHFEDRGAGSFLAYLRRILLNAVRDELRSVARRPRTELSEDVPDARPSPVEQALGRETLERYERALGELTEDQREAVLLRLELGLSYAGVAEAMGRPSPDAARMLVGRALVHLAEAMRERA